MDKISLEQRFTLLAKLGENIDWDLLAPEQVQVGIRESKRAGMETTKFIRDGFWTYTNDLFRETGEVAIKMPALSRLTVTKKIQSIHDISPIEPIIFRLGASSLPPYVTISGNEYERRMAASASSPGYQHALWLVEHQLELPDFMGLLGKICIRFPGSRAMFTDVPGVQYPIVYEGCNRWVIDWSHSGCDFSARHRFAISEPIQV